MSDDGIVKIHGKDYQTVALRLSKMKADHKNWRIHTELISDGMHVTFKAQIVDDNGHVQATGHASEERGGTGINATSALENAETSAVGRCLALAGYAGTEIRSADEMGDAVIEQATKAIEKRYGEQMAIIRDILPQVMDLKDQLADGNYHAVVEIVFDLTEEQRNALWIAPTKGGVLTTKERDALKSDEFAAARKEINKRNEDYL